MTGETILGNARLVLPDRVIRGTVVVRDGLIEGVEPREAHRGEDLDGDFLLPGLVELHTDHLESHYAPRPGVRWPALAALQAHDAQMATSGVTTVLDCLRMGSDEFDGFARGEMRVLGDAIAEGTRQGRLRADHYIHLRCEVSAPDVLDDFADFEDDEQVRLVSLMDHSPGQRQFQTIEEYARYYRDKRGLSEEAFARFVDVRQEQSRLYAQAYRHRITKFCRTRGTALASHDDATRAHVGEAVEQGVRVAEFPTTLDAARASHDAGLHVLMGAPNVVRGGSHSGNIAAMDLARAGLLDVLSSDYVPSSLMQAVFMLAGPDGPLSLSEAVATVTANPARAVGFMDRGGIEPGLRGDLVRVRQAGGPPQIVSVWRLGRRVA